MTGRIASVNVAGSARPNPASRGRGVTGIDKQPVDAAEVRPPGPRRGGLGSGLVGDTISNARYHGGDRQAVYAYAREELDAWEARLGRALANGLFGENLTTEGVDVDGALIGERWAVGAEVVLEVTAPRTPCATFAARMGERAWARRFTEVGRSGAYLSVETGGTVRPGDSVEMLSRPDHGVDVELTFMAFMGDLDAARGVLAGNCLPEDEVAWLQEQVLRRS